MKIWVCELCNSFRLGMFKLFVTPYSCYFFPNVPKISYLHQILSNLLDVFSWLHSSFSPKTSFSLTDQVIIPYTSWHMCSSTVHTCRILFISKQSCLIVLIEILPLNHPFLWCTQKFAKKNTADVLSSLFLIPNNFVKFYFLIIYPSLPLCFYIIKCHRGFLGGTVVLTMKH